MNWYHRRSNGKKWEMLCRLIMQQKDNMENREKGGSQNGSLWRTTHWEVKTNDLDPEEMVLIYAFFSENSHSTQLLSTYYYKLLLPQVPIPNLISPCIHTSIINNCINNEQITDPKMLEIMAYTESRFSFLAINARFPSFAESNFKN